MEEALRSYLLATAGLKALVGTRIDWNSRPQAAGLPALVLHRVSGGRNYTMKGRIDLTDALIQMDVWAGTYAEAKQVSRALLVALDLLKTPPLQAFVESERDSFEAGDGPQGSGSTDFHRVSTDVRVWHTEP